MWVHGKERDWVSVADLLIPTQDWNTPVQPFPKGLRMITGNPNAKAPSTPPYLTYQCQKTPDDIYVSSLGLTARLPGCHAVSSDPTVRTKLEFRFKVQQWYQD
jgi:hypothetical protein